MDVLKAIPQAFFDFIARMLPGAVAITLVEVTVPGSWKNALTILSGGLLTADNVFAFVTLLGAAASYALGQLLSPLGKVVDKGTQMVARIGRRLTNPEAAWPLPTREDWEKYDRLRVNAPVPGSFAVKIRAEYTMYNSLAAAFFLSAMWSTRTPLSIEHKVGILTAAVLMAWRGWGLQGTFRSSVHNLYDAVLRPISTPAKEGGAA